MVVDDLRFALITLIGKEAIRSDVVRIAYPTNDVCVTIVIASTFAFAPASTDDKYKRLSSLSNTHDKHDCLTSLSDTYGKYDNKRYSLILITNMTV